MALHSFERETTFGWDDSTDICQCITFNRALDRKLQSYCKEFPDLFKQCSEQVYDGIVEGHEYEFPKKFLTLRKPTKKKREMTEEQKRAAAERLKKARQKKEKNKEDNI